MNYNWDLLKWIRMQLPYLIRLPLREKLMLTILAPIKRTDVGSSPDSDLSLYTQFLAYMEFIRLRANYNSQQKSLTALLNKLFDPTLKRIYLVTTSDVLPVVYGQFGTESRPVVYGQKGTESRPVVYGRIAQEYFDAFDGYVYVPLELVSNESEIRAWVNYNIFFGKKYTISYY